MIVAQIFQIVRDRLKTDDGTVELFQDRFLAFEVLLAQVLNKSKEFFLIHPECEVLQEDFQRAFILWEKYLNGEPLAYLLGHKEFYGLDFIVDRRVLIPRPETELLVDKVLDFVEQTSLKNGKILDVGTGSGCIALTIKKNLPNFEVQGCDISTEALEVAQLNARRMGLKIDFFESDLLMEVKSSFDIVVANLPYIGRKSFSFISEAVAEFEPHLALFGGDDGLQLYCKLFEQIKDASWKPSLLLGEFGFLQRQELEESLNKFFPQAKITFEKDLAHIERAFVVIFPRS